MIVENGYAEMDRPSPRPRVGTSMARLGTGGSFSRYMHEGDKRLPGSPRQQTKYESGGTYLPKDYFTDCPICILANILT